MAEGRNGFVPNNERQKWEGEKKHATKTNGEQCNLGTTEKGEFGKHKKSVYLRYWKCVCVCVALLLFVSLMRHTQRCEAASVPTPPLVTTD